MLAVIAFNLTRAAATHTGPQLARATTATIRRKLIAVPAGVASSARRIILHLPTPWRWETARSGTDQRPDAIVDVFNDSEQDPAVRRWIEAQEEGS